LIRAGSILPLEKNGELELHIYPTTESHASGIIYSDSGDGYGQWRTDQYEYHRLNSGASIVRQVTGTYPFPYSKLACVVHGEEVQCVWMDGEEVEVRNA
jgi:alpha-glucosidase